MVWYSILCRLVVKCSMSQYISFRSDMDWMSMKHFATWAPQQTQRIDKTPPTKRCGDDLASFI